MEHIEILIYPSNEIDPEKKILGISLLERAAAITGKFFKSSKVYAPFIDKPREFRGITISNDFPSFNRDILLIDPAFLFEEKLLFNITSRFNSTAVACHGTNLDMLGFAYISKDDICEEFHRAPWFNTEEIIKTNLGTRVAVIDAGYYWIKEASDFKKACTFLLGSASRKDDGIISRNLNRFISVPVTRLFAPFRIHPVAWTFISLLTGISGCLFILKNTYSSNLQGMLLIQLSSILAGVDGETARLKFQKTTFGKWLNMVSNDLVVWPFLAAITYTTSESVFLRETGKLLLVLYPLYILMKYVYAVRYSKEKCDLETFALRTERCEPYDKAVPPTIQALIKRDFIIFFGLILSLVGILHIFSPLFLFSIMLLISISIFRFIKKVTAKGDEK